MGEWHADNGIRIEDLGFPMQLYTWTCNLSPQPALILIFVIALLEGLPEVCNTISPRDECCDSSLQHL